MILQDYYQNTKYDFDRGIRYYLETPLGQIKMFVERKNNKVVLQFFPNKELLKVFGSKK